MASQKLRHYFQECSITVASEVPLNDIINNRDATGQIAKWAIELLPFDITYKPRRAIKSQVLADFVAEWPEAELPKEYDAYSNWIMHFDGSKMLAGLCRLSGNRGPQTCLPVACGMAQVGAQYNLASSAQAQDPREGPSLARRMTEASS